MSPFRHELRDTAVQAALRNIEACGLSVQLKTGSIEIFAQNGMRLIELSTTAQIMHFSRELGDPPAPAAPGEKLQALIDDLQTELACERDLHKALAARHDILQSRLTATERQFQAALAANAAETRRYTKLKNFLAKEFHPDYFHGTAIEKRYRTEIFKFIWMRIEEIDKA